MHRTLAGGRWMGPASQEMGSTPSVRVETARTSPLAPLPQAASRGRRQNSLSNRRSRRLYAIGRMRRSPHLRPQATAWAQKSMASKNLLITADCRIVEAAFATRLAELADGAAAEATSLATSADAAAAAAADSGEKTGDRSPLSPPVHSEGLIGEFGPSGVNNAVAWHIDKGALTLNEPRHNRDRAHLRFASAQPCLICGRRPSDAHHLRFAQPGALGRRVRDEYAVPLCRSHHRALHRHGDEAAWWERNKVDPIAVARELWQRTRLEGPNGRQVEEKAQMQSEYLQSRNQ
jgi:hypothetical protein